MPCAVLKCISNSKNFKQEGKKVHCFRIPSGCLENWKKVLNKCNLHANAVICELHFSTDDYEWERDVIGANNTVIGKTKLKVPRLKPGVVPTKNLKNEKIALEIESSIVLSVSNEPLNLNTIEATDSKDLQQNDIVDTFDTLDHNATTNDNLLRFEDIVSDQIKIISSKNWLKHVDEYEKTRCVYLSQTVMNVMNGFPKINHVKEIIVTQDLFFIIYVLGKIIYIRRLLGRDNVLKSIDELQSLVKKLDNMNVCKGYHNETSKQYKNMYTDSMNIQRHVLCSLLLEKGSNCKFCKKMQNVINKSQSRQKKEAETKSSNRSKLCKLKNAQRSKRRLKESKRTCKMKLAELQEKMSTMSNKKMEDLFKETCMENNKKLAIKEIIEAAKRKPKGRRYSEEWLLLCMLFHIQSPSGYNFLFDFKILLLPQIRTIRRYLSRIKIDVGFDPQFFEIFRKFMETKTSLQKHGLLIIDEMSAREQVQVNSTTLTYTGLQDFGEGKACGLDEKANHGLVFMFQPIFDNYSHPIAVFASRGAASGVILAKLIIKALILLHKAGANMHGVITDGAPTNRSCWMELGVSGKHHALKNYFWHPTVEGKKISCSQIHHT